MFITKAVRTNEASRPVQIPQCHHSTSFFFRPSPIIQRSSSWAFSFNHLWLNKKMSTRKIPRTSISILYRTEVWIVPKKACKRLIDTIVTIFLQQQFERGQKVTENKEKKRSWSLRIWILWWKAFCASSPAGGLHCRTQLASKDCLFAEKTHPSIKLLVEPYF